MVVASDSSSTISDTRRTNILLRDGGTCVLCGDEPVDVAHIVARKAGDTGQVPFIQSVSSLYRGFRKDDPPNLLCLCPSHHHQYDRGYYVLVPSPRQREVLLKHEYSDFANRESAIASNQPDPGRTLPTIMDEIEYIPIHARGYHAYIHSPTRYDPEVFMFDSTNHHPCPLLHFQASEIALMVQAQPHLASVIRIQSIEAELAEQQITTLLKLYRRHPGAVHATIQVPAAYDQIASMVIQSSTHPSSHILLTIPSSPPSSHPSASVPSMSYSLNPDPELPGLTPSLSANTDGASEDTEIDPGSGIDSDTELDHDPLLGPIKEKSMTWEDLKNRPPLFPGEGGGSWQFSSAEQIIRGEWPA